MHDCRFSSSAPPCIFSSTIVSGISDSYLISRVAHTGSASHLLPLSSLKHGCQTIGIASALGFNVAPGPSARHLASASDFRSVIPTEAAFRADEGPAVSMFLMWRLLASWEPQHPSCSCTDNERVMPWTPCSLTELGTFRAVPLSGAHFLRVTRISF